MLKWKLFKSLKVSTSILFRNFLFLLLFFSFFIKFSTPSFAAQATLQFSPSSSSHNLGDTFNIAILLNTGGARTSATDLDISFDSNKLVLADIIPGNLYDQYVGEEINNASGRAIISGLVNSPDTLYTGSGTFATLSFKAIDTGTAQVTFNFTPGNRNDSGVYDHDAGGEDILSSVTNGSYSVSGTSTGSTTTTTNNTSTATNNTSTGTTTTNTSKGGQMPVAASSSSTLIMAVISLVLIALGAITAKFSF